MQNLRVQVVSSRLMQGKGKQSGKPYSFAVCDAVVTDTLTGEVKTAEFMVDSHEPIKLGTYHPVVQFGTDQQKRAVIRIKGLQPAQAQGVAKAA